MSQPDSLPPVFGNLRDSLQYVKRRSQDEMSAACPQCGGMPHANGEFPDRLRIFLDEPARLWCRRCGWFAFADNLAKPADPGAVEAWRKKQEQRELARKRSAERALENLRSEKIWERYHEALDAQSRAYWRRRGISDSLQDYWQLGWKCQWSFTQADGSVHHTASATIPIFGYEWVARNVKHRLIEPPPNRGKYLYELCGQNGRLFLCQPHRKLEGQVIAVEGEIKSMVTQKHLSSKHLVVGLPGLSLAETEVQDLAQAERILLILDPGSQEQAVKLTRALGPKRCRVLIPPVKIDDGLIVANLSEAEVWRMLGAATPMS